MCGSNYKGIWLIAVSLMIAGCETGSVRQDVIGKMEKEVESAAKSNEESEAVPENISDSLIPSISLGAAAVPTIEDEQKFDISVNKVPADQFFLSLVDGTDYNMVIHPEVSGSITLNLRNVSIPEVLEAVRDVYGFEFVRTSYGFQVLPGRLRARIFQINYLNVSRTGSSQTTVSSGSLTQADTSGDSSRSGDGGVARTGGTGSSSRSVLGTEISTRQPESGFWQELQTSVEAIVGVGEGRSVVVNPQSGVIVVRALPNELREVESYLQATQLIVQRQVILEAKILEVRLDEGFQAGINWSGLLKPGNNSITASQIGGGSVLVNESGTSDIAGTSTSLNPENPQLLDGALSSAFGGVFTLALDLGDFTSFIELLETQGNVQVLSSPRVSTMNNQKAVIKVGTDEFFVTDVTTTTVTGTSTTITPSVTLTPFFSGIALDVTPQISEGGQVTLHVHPSVSEVVDQQKTVTIGNTSQQLPLALSTVRESDSIIRARSGQVVVIGGLMQDQTDDRAAQTPGLGRIPLLGNLFKHQSRRSSKSELVILLKPTVVGGDGEWLGAVKDAGKSLRELRKSMLGSDSEEFLDDLFEDAGEE
ncbi:MAG: pilus (MSHA type) biogenesis protein MshL [Gammaproteobacteria bacterium]